MSPIQGYIKVTKPQTFKPRGCIVHEGREEIQGDTKVKSIINSAQERRGAGKRERVNWITQLFFSLPFYTSNFEILNVYSTRIAVLAFSSAQPPYFC